MAVRALGGSYSAIRIGEATGLNPFQTEVDERGAAWLTDWLGDILASTRGFETAQTVSLNAAVRQIVAADPRLRTFDGLGTLVASTDDEGDLVSRVREWGQGGRYGWLFGPGAASEISLGEDVVGIDMSEILDLGTERSALLAYLFRRIERVIEDRRPTLIVIDEAWKMLDDPIFEKRLHDWLVTMRKKNAAVMMLTQTPTHLTQSKVGQIIAESVVTQLLYPNPRANPEDYRILRLNEKEAEFLCTPTGGLRLALLRSAGDSVFVNMDLAALGSHLAVLGGGRIRRRPRALRLARYPRFLEGHAMNTRKWMIGASLRPLLLLVGLTALSACEGVETGAVSPCHGQFRAEGKYFAARDPKRREPRRGQHDERPDCGLRGLNLACARALLLGITCATALPLIGFAQGVPIIDGSRAVEPDLAPGRAGAGRREAGRETRATDPPQRNRGRAAGRL